MQSPGIAPPATPEIAVVAATRLEAWAVRRAIPQTMPIVRIGVGGTSASRLTHATAVVCGLAGSLTDELAAGSVLIPQIVGLPSGESITCDSALQDAFLRAARELGFTPSSAPLITLPTMATGAEREAWRCRGFAAVDMESALAVAADGRLAVVRVVLDSPRREISGEWLSPVAALARPWLWPQAVRLAIDAPRYALRAARIVARGLSLAT